ncbi:MAG: HAD family phosphatase [Rectinemataceae bacterium]|nr:HAD family phosphatase [Rectinemataceae bacterium]
MKADGRALKTIIFDCGRVITFDQDMKLAARMATLVGAPTDHFIRIYAEERGEYDRGTLSAADYWAKVAARFGCEIGGAEGGKDAALAALIELDLRSWFTINPETIAIVRQLKTRGYRLLILSNMNLEGKLRMLGEARYLDGEDWIALFDEVIVSCDLKLLKPEPAIYAASLKLANARAGECLFIDDNPENVAAARASGMNALVFTGATQLASTLQKEYGVL